MTASADITTVAASVPAVVRGRIVDTDLTEFGNRAGGSLFRSPDPRALLGELPLRDPLAINELGRLPFDEIVYYLGELGRRLEPADNIHLQEALARSESFSDLTRPLLAAAFARLPSVFEPSAVREVADATIGIPYLQGWVPRRMLDGRTVSIRAVGARAVHVIAGNHPLIAAMTIVRNAIARSDAIIKTPSNDPFTAVAIARTMVEMAPDHPITQHLSVAYWKGGDTEIEEALYQPRNVEKVVAWGGLASVTHILRYVRPGIELVALDPKRSASIIGREAFDTPHAMADAATRAATDIGALNQLGCVNARVIYVASGLDAAGLERANALGQLIHERLQQLPTAVSTAAKHVDRQLWGNIEALRANPDWYRVFGRAGGDGAVIVSQLDEAVDFHRSLGGRIANVVPVDDPADALRYIDASTQTIGIYPDALKTQMRDTLAAVGAQRLVSLGYAADAHVATPQDGIEPVRRMVKWIVDETCEPSEVAPMWEAQS